MKKWELVIYLSNLCNLSCQHCTIPKNPTHELSRKDLETLADYDPYKINLMGGETLLAGNLKDAFEVFSNKPITVSTNGLKVPEKIKLLEKARMVLISVEGLEKNTNLVRGEGVFKKVINAAKLLRDHGVEVALRASVWDGNLNDVPGLVKLAKKLDTGLMLFPRLGSVPFSPAQQEWLFREMVGGKNWIDQPNFYAWMAHEFVAKGGNLKDFTDKFNLNCPAGERRLAVDWNGSLHPCQWCFSFYLGKVGDPFDLIEESAKGYVRSFKRPPLECVGCVPPDTLVAGEYKRIDKIGVGDYIIGGPIKQTFNRQYAGFLKVIKAIGVLPLKLTPEHPVLVRTLHQIYEKNPSGKPRWKIKRVFSEPYFKRADKVTELSSQLRGKGVVGDYLLIPRPRGELQIKEIDLAKYSPQIITRAPKKFPLNTRTAWLLGLYVADGWRSGNGCIAFSLPKNDSKTILKVCSVIKKIRYASSIKRIRKEQAVNVRLFSRILSRAFKEWCGRNAREKKVPSFILRNVDNHVIEAFLEGYFTGDGFKLVNGFGATTVSLRLALEIQLLLARLGYNVCVNIQKRKRTFIGERELKGGIGYRIQTYKPKGRYSRMRLTKDYLLTPVIYVRDKPYRGTVHNLETNSGTYLVSNVVVHNCEFMDTCQGSCPLTRICDGCPLQPNVRRIRMPKQMSANVSDKTVSALKSFLHKVAGC